MPAKISCCTQQRSGLETDSFEQRTCWARLRGWEIHGCPGLLLWSRFPQGGPCCFPTMRPHYSCLGKGEAGGKWVPWTSLGEGSMGRRRRTRGKWFACCPDAMFLSFRDFRASHCRSFKSREWLGAKLQGSGWHLPLASNGGPILVWCTFVHMLSAPHKGRPWSLLRSSPLHCLGSGEGPDLFPASPYAGVASSLRQQHFVLVLPRVFTGYLGLEVKRPKP